jgi:hypothetical protein
MIAIKIALFRYRFIIRTSIKFTRLFDKKTQTLKENVKNGLDH